MSISDISNETGLSRASVWSALRKQKHHLRSQESVPFERWRQGTGKTKARPPYGFRFFRGEVIEDPAEYPTLQFIGSLMKQGLTISSIVLRLNSRDIRSRMKKPWSYNVIKAVIKRIQSGSTSHLISSSKPKKSKNKTVEVESESR